MKRTILLLLTTLLVLTSACSGNNGSTQKNTASAAATTAVTTTTAAPAYGPGNYPTDDAYHPETDDVYFRTGANAGSMVAEVENGFYFLLDSTLMYADRDTMEPIPVCPKPNCRHYEETDTAKMQDCNAYFRAFGASGVYYSGGYLYVFHAEPFSSNTYALTRVSADGTERRTLHEMNMTFPLHPFIHRGRFYIAQQDQYETGTSSVSLWSYSLDNPGEEPLLLYQSDERQFSRNIIKFMYAYGNHLYILESLQAPEDAESTVDEVDVLRILDLATNEWTVVENPEGYTAGLSCIAGGRLVTTHKPIGGSALYNTGETVNLDGPMFVRALDGSNPEEITVDIWGAITADEQYIYLNSPRLTELTAAGEYITSTPGDSIYFYDPDMNLVDELPFECLAREGATLGSCTICPMRGDKYLLHTRYGGNFVFYWFDRDQIGTGEITPVEFLSYEWNTFQFINN